MKKTAYIIIHLICAAVALIFSSCTSEEVPVPVSEGETVYPKIRVGVSSMEMKADTRATEPMRVDVENYVTTIAVFEFDNEGLHIKSNKTYHFIDFIKGTVDGVYDVGVIKDSESGIIETSLEGIPFEAYTNGTLCLVANVTEDEVDAFYKDYREEGQTYGYMTLAKFKTWSLPFTYVEQPTDRYDESTSGYITTMYMFGYYEGPIVPAEMQEISVDLGRLASRIDITIVNQTGADITKRLGYHFDNVCSSAYFFPILSGMPPTIGAGIVRTVICAGENDPVEGDPDFKIVPEIFPDNAVHTRYYYAAAHSAAGYADATKLHLFYDRRIVDDDTSDNSSSTWVPLCNVHPSEAASVKNGYSLSRNTCYHFTINLKSKTQSPSPATRGSAAEDELEVEYGANLGEVTVYLPID